MNSRAVIDIGTNTINLLVARQHEGDVLAEHFERIPARLGEGGMQSDILTEEAMDRGLQALSEHKARCASLGVSEIKVTATSAVRSASNRQIFVSRVAKELGLSIEVIDGDREAELIWKGVRQTGLLDAGVQLIMDIGGGSTEFILGDSERIFWQRSYRLGVTRLKERFQAPDPFTVQSEAEMSKALIEDLKDLWLKCRGFDELQLIGASGSFNSVDLMLAIGDVESLPEVSHALNVPDYMQLSNRLRRTDRSGRSLIPGLVPDRVETMPYAALLIDVVIDKLDITEMYRSSYALKEGLVVELFD